MNNLLTNTATMSSREIAALTGSRHDAVRKSARRLEADQILTSPLAESAFRTNSGSHQEFHFNKRDSLILVARLSPEFTAAIVDRWQELESQHTPAIPQTYAAALIEAGRLAQIAEEQAEKLAIAAPKVAFVDELVNRDNLMTATQVGQKHKMSAIKLNRFLDELGGVYSKRVERGRVFLQPFINKGYGELKQNNTGHDQPLFTNKGEIWINEQLAAKGVE